MIIPIFITVLAVSVAILWPIVMLTLSIRLREKTKKEFLSNHQHAELPGHPGTYIINSHLVDLNIVSEMLTTFITEYKEKMPDAKKLKTKLPFWDIAYMKKHLMIEFQPGKYFYRRNSENIEYPEGHEWRQKLWGQMVARHYAVVATTSDEENFSKLGNTALIHELNHWALAYTSNDWGTDHTHPWTKEHDELAKAINANFK